MFLTLTFLSLPFSSLLSTLSGKSILRWGLKKNETGKYLGNINFSSTVASEFTDVQKALAGHRDDLPIDWVLHMLSGVQPQSLNIWCWSEFYSGLISDSLILSLTKKHPINVSLLCSFHLYFLKYFLIDVPSLFPFIMDFI